MNNKLKVDQSDWSFVPVEPNPDFDPKHNQEVIDSVIKANERLASRKERESEDGIKERSEILARYFKSVASGKTTSKLDKYLGEHELARLRGEQIIKKLRFSDLGEQLKQKLVKSAKSAKLKSQYGYMD